MMKYRTYSEVMHNICRFGAFESTELSRKEGRKLEAEWIQHFSVIGEGVRRKMRFHQDEILNHFLDYPTIPFQRGSHAIAALAGLSEKQEMYLLTPTHDGAAFSCNGFPCNLSKPEFSRLSTTYGDRDLHLLPVVVGADFSWTCVFTEMHRGPFFCSALSMCS